jgi:hypothetical protein
MSPVLEEQPAAIGEALEGLPVVGPEAAPQRQVMGSLHHVDRVELEPAHVLDEGDQGARGQPARPRAREVLSGQEERGGGAAADPGRGHGGAFG